MINNRKLERVAKAICQAAGRYTPPQRPYSPDDPPLPEQYRCLQCYNELTGTEECAIWYTFKGEAEAAIKAMKGF